MRNLLRHPATVEEIVDCLRKEAEAASRRSDEELSAGDMTAYLLRKAADIVAAIPERKIEAREREAESARLRAALEPFATFGADNVGEHGWLSNIHRERISYWFGPSDFRAAAVALADTRQPTAATEPAMDTLDRLDGAIALAERGNALPPEDVQSLRDAADELARLRPLLPLLKELRDGATIYVEEINAFIPVNFTSWEKDAWEAVRKAEAPQRSTDDEPQPEPGAGR